MKRRLVVASALAIVVTAGFLPSSGFGSSGAGARRAQGIPAGLAKAIHARFGAGAIRSSWAARATEGPEFGYSVALSADGTTALVGARGVHHGRGAVYVFHVSDAGSWSASDTPAATLTYSQSSTLDRFGSFIGLSADGTTAFVGAYFAEGSADGAVYVFHVSAEDAWTSSSTPTATLSPSSSYFGISLAVSPDGTTLVVASPYYASDAGAAYVFHVSSEDAWVSTSTPTAILTDAGESVNDSYVGRAVAISADGSTALVSDDGNPSGGGAFLYHVSAEDAWTSSSTPTAILTDANSGNYDELGGSVALSGDGTVALLGAPGANSADVFHASGEAAWASTSTPTATLRNGGGSPYDIFGYGVAVASDGATALVSAPGVHRFRGAAYIFHVSDEGAWASSSTPTATLTDSGGHAYDLFGGAPPVLSADGATALVGAPDVRFETGAANVFHAADASSWASSSTPTAVLSDSALNACVVPSLKGLTVIHAKAALKARSCRLGRVRRVRAHAKSGHVVSQSIKSGARRPVGTKVAIKVAR